MCQHDDLCETAPLLPDLLSEWRAGSQDPLRRFQVALALLLLSPDTEGLSDSLNLALDGGGLNRQVAILLLAELGPRAAPAARGLRRIAENDPVEDTRAVAKYALGRILGDEERR